MTTHGPSWVEGASGSLFDVDNLPYGVFATEGSAPRVGVRYADSVVDVSTVRPELDRPAELITAAFDTHLASARRWFTSFGSCSVTEPRDDLVALGLLAPDSPEDS
jgi:hypothetical protein